MHIRTNLARRGNRVQIRIASFNTKILRLSVHIGKHALKAAPFLLSQFAQIHMIWYFYCAN